MVLRQQQLPRLLFSSTSKSHSVTSYSTAQPMPLSFIFLMATMMMVLLLKRPRVPAPTRYFPPTQQISSSSEIPYSTVASHHPSRSTAQPMQCPYSPFSHAASIQSCSAPYATRLMCFVVLASAVFPARGLSGIKLESLRRAGA